MSALPHQLVWQARQIAEAHSLKVIPVTDQKRDPKSGELKNVPAWVVYRNNPHNTRCRLGDRINKTTRPKKLLAIVRTAAGITDDKPAGGDARR